MADVFLLDPELGPWLGDAGMRDADDLFALGVHDVPHRFVGFVQITARGESRRFHLKRYHYAGWAASKGLVGRGSLWGRAPEVREFEALAWLRSNDVPAVRPAAAASRTRAGRLVAHGLLTVAVADAADLAARLRAEDDPLRTSDGLRAGAAGAIGAALGRMHARGFVHRDCHARNVLVRIRGGEVAVRLLDCRRGGPGGRREAVKDLATLDRDLEGTFSPGERRLLLEAWLDGAPGLEELSARVAAVRRTLPAPR